MHNSRYISGRTALSGRVQVRIFLLYLHDSSSRAYRRVLFFKLSAEQFLRGAEGTSLQKRQSRTARRKFAGDRAGKDYAVIDDSNAAKKRSNERTRWSVQSHD